MQVKKLLELWYPDHWSMGCALIGRGGTGREGIWRRPGPEKRWGTANTSPPRASCLCLLPHLHGGDSAPVLHPGSAACLSLTGPVWNQCIHPSLCRNMSVHTIGYLQHLPMLIPIKRISLKLLPLSFLSTESYDDPTQQLVPVQPLKEKDFCGTKREHVLLFARNLHC